MIHGFELLSFLPSSEVLGLFFVVGFFGFFFQSCFSYVAIKEGPKRISRRGKAEPRMSQWQIVPKGSGREGANGKQEEYWAPASCATSWCPRKRHQRLII